MPAYDTEVEWGRLPAAAIRRRAEADAIVLIPIGATEQHGPHLPTMVDHRLVFEVACRGARMIAEREPVLVTPVIPFGMSEHHVSLGGTITLDYATMAAVVGCVVDSATARASGACSSSTGTAATSRRSRRSSPS
jgi:creatinine amidohydrolase